ncbi:DinB family protein [Brevundimonas sp.]|uniref:DinB family protein n=1 Tax=Brevundimonas sp. TaxID=1871086 RepID=UPI0035AF1BF4
MTPARDVLLRQWNTARALLDHHLADLTTEACLWRPAPVGLHLTRDASGAWHGEWPTHEGYDLGPPSIGWTSWHLGMWLSLALAHTHSHARPTRNDVRWPGSGPDAASWIADLADRWRAAAEALPASDWASTGRTRWPFTDRSFADLFAWSVVELTKNAAEIGQGRFLYAVSAR